MALSGWYFKGQYDENSSSEFLLNAAPQLSQAPSI